MAFGWGAAMGGLPLFAAAERVDTGPIYYVGLGVVVVIALVAIVVFYRTWDEISEDEEPDSPADLLESFREAHAAGEIDDRELERVKQLLSIGGDRPTGRPTPRAAACDVPAPADVPTEVDPASGSEG